MKEIMHRCQGCGKLLVSETPQPGDVPALLKPAAAGVIIDRPPSEVPRVRCPCGLVTRLMRGRP